MESWASIEGTPTPLGATWIPEEEGYNFALFSKRATRVRLLFYSAKEVVAPLFIYDFDAFKNKSGFVWHCRIPKSSLAGVAFYAYSVEGPPAGGSDSLQAFQPGKILLDPYAGAVFFPPMFERAAAIGPGSNAGKGPLCVFVGDEGDFDWGDDRPPRHDGDLVIYEIHVRGFTMSPKSGISPGKRGTFAGVIEKIPYLNELGVTAVELMPIFQFDQTEPNYWGYMPLNFFAPHHQYATRHQRSEQVKEFREMVKALHKTGIEVFLDVVYNHTGEGDETGPTYSFKGIDNSTYYMESRDQRHPYADFTGTGNTLDCTNPTVRQLILDSLTYWVREMHVDGFRFDLASVFSRRRDGSINLDDPPIFGDIAADPQLVGVRLIAEPWEGNPRYPNYELGEQPVRVAEARCCCAMPECRCPPAVSALQRGFPGMGWRQWNDRFRKTVRHFVKSDPGLVGDLMTRIYGSSDLFPDSLDHSYRPYQSVNYVCSHDGLTLYDLVSSTTEDSWNCGEQDGDKGVSPEVMKLRKRQVKNFCSLLFLSNGTPMFRAGDEFLQTQNGDPNPYNVDSPKAWLDWSRLECHRDIFRFFQKMIAFRKSQLSLARSTFWRDDVKWYGLGREVDWSYESRALAFCLHDASQKDNNLYVLINAHWKPANFVVQEGQPTDWHRVIDTCLDSPEDFMDAESSPRLPSLSYTVQPRSVVVLLRPLKQAHA